MRITSQSTVLITGASSGLGAALAEAYAHRFPGIRLLLTARRSPELQAVADRCRSAGADPVALVVDVTDRARMATLITSLDADRNIDLVIANAGISGGTGGPSELRDGIESEEQARCIFDTNLVGVLNTVLPLIPLMTGRGRGQIALMASLAGYRGQPGAPAYCGSKAAVKVWGESLRGTLAPHGVRVSVITPGFVKSPMTDANGFRMPFLQQPEKAAEIMIRGLERNTGRIAFPWPMALAAWFLSVLPDPLADIATRRLPRMPPSA